MENSPGWSTENGWNDPGDRTTNFAVEKVELGFGCFLLLDDLRISIARSVAHDEIKPLALLLT